MSTTHYRFQQVKSLLYRQHYWEAWSNVTPTHYLLHNVRSSTNKTIVYMSSDDETGTPDVRTLRRRARAMTSDPDIDVATTTGATLEVGIATAATATPPETQSGGGGVSGTSPVANETNRGGVSTGVSNTGRTDAEMMERRLELARLRLQTEQVKLQAAQLAQVPTQPQTSATHHDSPLDLSLIHIC